MERALELTGIVDALENATLNSGAKASARSRFESTKQRFFGQVLLSMKLPTVIAAVENHLRAGQSVVMQLVTTAESILDRRLGSLGPDERAALEIDLSPKEYILSGSPDNRNSLQSRFMSSVRVQAQICEMRTSILLRIIKVDGDVRRHEISGTMLVSERR